jgi:Transposase DDE domain group 1
MAESTRQSVLFGDAFSRPLTVTFDGDMQSSDAGLVLLGALDSGIGLSERLVRCLVDPREPLKVRHGIPELFRQRMFSIAAGYADCNDAAVVGNDPMLKEVCGRGVGGEALASQPTLSRFENAWEEGKHANRLQRARELVLMGREIEDFVIERHKKRLGRRAKLVTIDLDPTDDPTHGQQAFTFFNGHYDTWCYLPLLGFLTFNDEPDQFLCVSRLRPGNATAPRNAFPVLRRLVGKLRSAFPKATIRVRLDGGFACPRTFALLEELGVEYVVGLPGNKRLDRLAGSFRRDARERQEASGETDQVFGEVLYRPKKKAKKRPWLSWPHRRRVVVKAEVVTNLGSEPRDNTRYVVTNMTLAPEAIYEIYRGRGESENRIKELHHGLEFDRTSCSSFLGNQLRLLATATAYVLFQELRLRLKRTELGRAQVSTLRDRLLKIGARVVHSVRRIVVHFPAAYPWQDLWRAIACDVGAVTLC